MKLPAKYINFIVFVVICLGLTTGAYYLGERSHDDIAPKTPAIPVPAKTASAPPTPPPSSKENSAGEDKTTPHLNFMDMEGHTHDFSDYKDKNIIVHFWATWCGPCVAELPSLLRRVSRDPEMVLIAFDEDDDPNVARQFLDTIGVKTDPAQVIHVWDRDRTVAHTAFGVYAYPESFVFEKNLKFIAHFRGSVPWENLGKTR